MTHKARNIITAIFLLLLLTPSVYAQKKGKTTKPAKTESVVSREEINYANLLPSTAKLMFIDSIVVDIENIYDHISLPNSCGKIKSEMKGGNIKYTYTNDFNTVRYSSIANNNGNHELYMEQRLGRNWSEPVKVELEGDFKDIICPYLMPDGITLYFSACGGEDNVGGHDLFYTIYDSDSHTFYRPQSLGLPYNSMSDDICYFKDDTNNIGHLVTTRNQPKNKACIYTFETTESRETYDADIETEHLAAFAAIKSIKSTQTDAAVLDAAKARLQSIRNSSSNEKEREFTFVVNGKKTYHKLSDFRTKTNAEKYQSYSNRLAELKQSEALLTSMREDYHNGDKSKANDILKLENQVMKERQALADIEKQIRNAELIK